MKKTIFVSMFLMVALGACAPRAVVTPVPQATLAPVENTMPVPPATATEKVVERKITAPAFEAQAYVNQSAGFALDYPAQWTVKETLTGDRGSQSVLLSSPEIADLETLPAGATRVAITLYQWDPKNDLAAFVESRKLGWSASGFTVVEEEPITLDLGLAAIRFTVQTADGHTVPFLFAALNNQYISISGEGDQALIKEIMLRLRPVRAQ